MSLGYVFTLCADGLFYRELAYWDPEKRWFICFDEDDPAELVIKDSAKLRPSRILKSLGIDYEKAGGGRRSGRLFGTNKFHDATSWLFNFKNDPPTPVVGRDEWGWSGSRKAMGSMVGTYCGYPESVRKALAAKR